MLEKKKELNEKGSGIKNNLFKILNEKYEKSSDMQLTIENYDKYLNQKEIDILEIYLINYEEQCMIVYTKSFIEKTIKTIDPDMISLEYTDEEISRMQSELRKVIDKVKNLLALGSSEERLKQVQLV